MARSGTLDGVWLSPDNGAEGLHLTPALPTITAAGKNRFGIEWNHNVSIMSRGPRLSLRTDAMEDQTNSLVRCAFRCGDLPLDHYNRVALLQRWIRRNAVAVLAVVIVNWSTRRAQDEQHEVVADNSVTRKEAA